jgi:hypothetical protein
MDERMINLLVFVATILAVSGLSYRLGFIRGVQRRARHKISPTIATKESVNRHSPDESSGTA